MHPDTAERILWTLAALGYATAILGIVGEFLGWWNDVGEVLTAGGTLVGMAMTASSIVINADKEQVANVRTGVETTHEKLDSVDGKLDSMDLKLESVDETVESVDEGVESMGEDIGSIGEDIESIDGKMDKLDKLDKLDELDVIQAELDDQTGAMDQQLQVLRQIRDAV